MSAEHPMLQSGFAAYVVEQGVIDKDYPQELLRSNPEVLLSRMWEDTQVDDEQLAATVAGYFGMKHLPGEQLTISDEVKEVLPRIISSTITALPMHRNGGVVYIAIPNPFDIDIRERLEALVGDAVELVVASKSQIEEVLREAAATVNQLDFVGNGLSANVDDEAANTAEHNSQEIDENSAPIVKLANTLLREAVSKKASDIHIEQQEDRTLIRYRIDGVLQNAMAPLELVYQEPLISRIKIMSELDITERQLPQDGRLRLILDKRPIDFRVSILPGIDGEDAVIRVLDSRAIVSGVSGLRLSDLEMPDELLYEFRRIISNPSGMIIVAGPTGSGKTTTLYAALNELDKIEGKTITIEDPVEYRLDGILQIPVNTKKKLTFSQGLRSILRHDPDRIMVGEIRDKETAEIAVQSALTGHLLFTTVHANTPLDVVNRLAHMGIPVSEMLPSISCIISQRLLRKVCPSCSRESSPDQTLLDDLELSRKEVEGWNCREGVGCNQCGNTGYLGRTVIAELLKMSPSVAHQIQSGATDSEIRDVAGRHGMMSIRESALRKVEKGATTFREVRRVLGVS